MYGDTSRISQISENEFPHLFLEMRFDTIRAEPIKRFTSDREALPIRGEAPIRKGRGLSILQK